MAMLLPQSLHHQLSATIRQRRLYHPSPRGARATHGESSNHASIDHFKVPSTEPCCNLVSPLVMITPKKPVRRSSRLRVRKERTDEIKTESMPTDMDAAEWASRVLANNGVVEVDPVTMAELMRQYQQVKHDTDCSDYHYTTSSQESSQKFFLPGSLRFPTVPLSVAVAAGSAVALALVAFLIQSLSKKQADGAIPSSDSLRSGFSGEPVRSSGGSPPSPPQRPRGNKVPAEVLAAGAAVATGRISTPLPPSLSKSGDDLKTRSQDKDKASATPFFTSDRSTVSSSGATPTSASRWQEDKYKSVRPFFPSDKLAQPVTPFFADDNTGSAKAVTPAQGNRTHGKGSSYESVPPFFPVGKSGSSKVVTPFFADEKDHAHGKGPTSVTPFFADEQQAKNGQSVAPFFPDEQQTKNGPSYMKNVPPFFPDEQQSKNGPSYMESDPPFFPDEQQTRNGPSYMETVPPFFPDEQQTGTGRSYMETVPPFFPDEQQTSNGASYMDTVRPFFADERASSLQDVTPFFGGEAKPRSHMETVQPFFADERQGVSGSLDLENVKPFFADEQQGVSGSLDVENVKPFFADEQQGVSGSDDLKNVKPFFADDRAGSSGAQRDSSAMSIGLRTGEERVLEDVLSGPMRSEGKRIANQMAGRAQGPHEAFMAGITADRLKSNNNGDFSFQGQARAPFKEVTLQLSPEELAILAEIKAEEERRQAKMQALQSAFPALAVGAGAIGAGLVGVDGAFEMVGLTATASFISYELLWANKRQELLDEISRITDHHKLFRFLQKRKIVKDDC